MDELHYTIESDGDGWLLTRPESWPGKRETDPSTTRSSHLGGLVTRAVHEAQQVARTGQVVVLTHPVQSTDEDGTVTSEVVEKRWPR